MELRGPGGFQLPPPSFTPRNGLNPWPESTAPLLVVLGCPTPPPLPCPQEALTPSQAHPTPHPLPWLLRQVSGHKRHCWIKGRSGSSRLSFPGRLMGPERALRYSPVALPRFRYGRQAQREKASRGSHAGGNFRMGTGLLTLRSLEKPHRSQEVFRRPLSSDFSLPRPPCSLSKFPSPGYGRLWGLLTPPPTPLPSFLAAVITLRRHLDFTASPHVPPACRPRLLTTQLPAIA